VGETVTPDFSVVIPAFNAEATLARAIDSVLEQTWPAAEIIVVDDGSRDATADVARRYEAPVRLLTQANAGVSAARNAGASVARGQWLAFLDADDWYYPNRLQAHADLIQAHPDLQLLTGNYDYVDQNGQRGSDSMSAHDSGRRLLGRACPESSLVMSADDELEAFAEDHFGDTHTLSVTRAMFERMGGYPLGFKVCEDVHLLLRLLAAAREVGVCTSPLAAYCIHGDSVTRRDRLAAQRENVRTLRDLLQRRAQFPLPVARGLARRMSNARYNLAVALLRAGLRGQAVGAMCPALWENPEVTSLRRVAALLWGRA
jgi:glycosyltransferase involved in cell wall biosynthesis